MKFRTQYHFRQSDDGLLAWDIKKLCKLSSKLKRKKIKLSDIKELDECFWYDLGNQKPTCRNIVNHIKLINEVDCSYPIILDKDGHIMDGMHRVCRALLENKQTILAVQFEKKILPDYIDVKPEELPYD